MMLMFRWTDNGPGLNGEEAGMNKIDLLSFTEDLPKSAGWYWIDRPDRKGWTIEWVDVRPGHNYLAICEEWGGRRDFMHVAALSARWAGPIPLPVETADNLKEPRQ